MQSVKQAFSKINSVKIFLSALVVILPIIGANISSFYDWSINLYYLADRLDERITKKEYKAMSMEVLLYIEPAIRDEITDLESTIQETILSTTMTTEVRDIALNGLKSTYKSKINELERIRKRIKVFDPNWKSIEELENVR